MSSEESSDLSLDKHVHWASDAIVVQDDKVKGSLQPVQAISCVAIPIPNKRQIDALVAPTTMLSAGKSKLRRMSKTIKSKVASVPFGDKGRGENDDGMMFSSHHSRYAQSQIQHVQQNDDDEANMPKPLSMHGSATNVSTTATLTIFQERQQRQLVLLRHATRCAYPPGSCPVTRHCADAKIVCDHISKCRKKRRCPFPHCVSSRYLLSHYKRCAGSDESVDSIPACSVCGPVRAAIIRGRNRVEEEMARDLEVNLLEMNL